MCPIISDWRKQPFSSYFRFAKNNRSKSVWTLFQRKRLNNQTVWPVIFGITGPICERALKSLHLLELRPRGHHDWPVMPVIRAESHEVAGHGIEESRFFSAFREVTRVCFSKLTQAVCR